MISLGGKVNKEDSLLYQKRNKLYRKGIFHCDPEIDFHGQKSDYKNEERIPKRNIPINYLDKIDNSNDLRFIWFGHSSFLIQLDNMNILVDPVFSNCASPVSFIGPKRFSELPIDIDKMPIIDLLVISHDHYDHLDYKTIKQLDNKVKKYLVPLGVEKHLLKWKINKDRIITISWWEEIKIKDLSIISIPTRHFSGRVPWRNNTTLWCGYLFKNNQYKVCYTGDTGYGNHFKEVYDKYGEIDLLILENGQYDKAWPNIHMMPSQGIQAIKDLHASMTIPVHWGTFSICKHAWNDSIKQLFNRKEDLNIASIKIGEIVSYGNIYQDYWWK